MISGGDEDYDDVKGVMVMHSDSSHHRKGAQLCSSCSSCAPVPAASLALMYNSCATQTALQHAARPATLHNCNVWQKPSTVFHLPYQPQQTRAHY